MRFEKRIITGIAAADHEDTRGSRDITTNNGAKRRVMLVPVEALGFLDVSRVPVQGVSIVVSVEARHIPVHLLRFAVWSWTRKSKRLLWLRFTSRLRLAAASWWFGLLRGSVVWCVG